MTVRKPPKRGPAIHVDRFVSMRRHRGVGRAQGEGRRGRLVTLTFRPQQFETFTRNVERLGD
jgi:hypothetical protein